MDQPIPKYLVIWGLAVSASGTAISTQANSQGSSLYGKVNVSLESAQFDGAGNIVQGRTAEERDQWELNSNASRLGVKGSFDLDDSGLTAIYLAEYEINVDDGASGDTAFSQRNIYAGLRGGFGEIRYGKFDTPLKVSEGKVDQFNDLHGDIDILIGGQNRVSNIIQFSTPVLASSITLNAAFIPAEGADSDQDGELDDGLADSASFSAIFDNKTVYVAFAYDKDQTARRSIDGIRRADLVRLVGGLNRGPVELGVLLQRTTDNLGGSDKEDASYLASAAFKSGQFKYKAQYGVSEGKESDEQASLAAVGLDYALAAQASLFAYWSSLTLDNAGLRDRTFGIGTSFSF